MFYKYKQWIITEKLSLREHSPLLILFAFTLVSINWDKWLDVIVTFLELMKLLNSVSNAFWSTKRELRVRSGTEINQYRNIKYKNYFYLPFSRSEAWLDWSFAESFLRSKKSWITFSKASIFSFESKFSVNEFSKSPTNLVTLK